MVRNKTITHEQHVSIAESLTQIFALITGIIEIVGFDDRNVNSCLIGIEMCFNILREYLDSHFMATSNEYDVRVYYPKDGE